MREDTALEFAPETRLRWAWSPETIRHFGCLVVDLIAHHLTSLPERPVFRPFPPELADRFLGATLPLAGQSPEEILAEFARDIEPYPFGNGHPRFYGQAFLSSTTLDGTFVLRACIINPRTTREDLERLVALVQDLGRQLASSAR